MIGFPAMGALWWDCVVGSEGASQCRNVVSLVTRVVCTILRRVVRVVEASHLFVRGVMMAFKTTLHAFTPGIRALGLQLVPLCFQVTDSITIKGRSNDGNMSGTGTHDQPG